MGGGWERHKEKTNWSNGLGAVIGRVIEEITSDWPAWSWARSPLDAAEWHDFNRRVCGWRISCRLVKATSSVLWSCTRPSVEKKVDRSIRSSFQQALISRVDRAAQFFFCRQRLLSNGTEGYVSLDSSLFTYALEELDKFRRRAQMFGSNLRKVEEKNVCFTKAKYKAVQVWKLATEYFFPSNVTLSCTGLVGVVCEDMELEWRRNSTAAASDNSLQVHDTSNRV